jgi:hypothetical protein
MKSTAPFGVTFDIGGLLSRTATVLRDDPVRFSLLTILPAVVCVALLGTATVVGASMAGLSLVMLQNPLKLVYTQLVPLLMAFSATSFVCALIALAAQSAVYVATEEALRGPRRSTWQAMVAGLQRLPAVLGVALVLALVLAACTAPVVALVSAAAAEGSWALGVAALPVGTVLFLVAAFLMLRFGLGLVAAVVDELSPIAALARSWQVTRGAMADYTVAALLLGVATTGLSVLATVVFVVPVLGQIAAVLLTLVSLVAPQVWLVLAYAGLSDRAGHPGR